MENGSQNGWFLGSPGAHFGSLFAILSFMLILCWLWLTFGSLLPPLGSPLVHFWLPLAPFWLTLGTLWLTFGALGLTFGAPVARFSHFWCLLASFFIFVHIFEENRMQNHIFELLLLRIRLVFICNCNCCTAPADNPRHPDGGNPPSLGPGADTLPKAT